MEPWLGLIGALAGVAVGALAEGLRSRAAFWRERRWDHQQERRRRLEDLYVALAEVNQGLTRHVTMVSLALLNSSDDLNIDGPVMPYSRVEMLVNLYLPELEPQLKELIAARNNMTLLLLHCVTSRKASKDARAEAAVALAQGSKDVSRVLNQIRELLAATARQHDWRIKGQEL